MIFFTTSTTTYPTYYWRLLTIKLIRPLNAEQRKNTKVHGKGAKVTKTKRGYIRWKENDIRMASPTVPTHTIDMKGEENSLLFN